MALQSCTESVLWLHQSTNCSYFRPAVSSWYQPHYWLIFLLVEKKDPRFFGDYFFSVETKIRKPLPISYSSSFHRWQVKISANSWVSYCPARWMKTRGGFEGGNDRLKAVIDELSMICFFTRYTKMINWIHLMPYIYIHMIDIRLHSNNLYYRIISYCVTIVYSIFFRSTGKKSLNVYEGGV